MTKPTINFVNATPHEVMILSREDNSILHVFPKGEDKDIIRLRTQINDLGKIYGIPVTQTTFLSTELPEGDWRATYDDYGNVDGYYPVQYFIVSQLVKNAFPQRGDLLVPAEVVRDDKGVIIGCYSLGM